VYRWAADKRSPPLPLAFMILTPHFAMLHFPRSGTAFCDKAVVGRLPGAEIYNNSGRWGRHNYRFEIPAWWSDVPIIGVKRDVFDLWASWFLTRLAANGLAGDTFGEYYEGVNRTGGQVRHGEQCKGTGGFMRKYRKVMFGDRYGNMDDVLFLDIKNLNLELYELMKSYGHDDPSILQAEPVNVGAQRAGKSWKKIIPVDMVEQILKDEEE